MTGLTVRSRTESQVHKLRCVKGSFLVVANEWRNLFSLILVCHLAIAYGMNGKPSPGTMVLDLYFVAYVVPINYNCICLYNLMVGVCVDSECIVEPSKGQSTVLL